MNIYPFKALYPNQQLIPSPDEFFKTVSNNYVQYKKANFFKVSSQKSIFVYQISGSDYQFNGLIVSNDILDLEEGHILGHENTLAQKEQVMTNLVLSRKAMIKPILLGYEGHSIIDEFLQEYIASQPVLYEFNLEEKAETHRFWSIDEDEKIKCIQELFKNYVPQSYIADGHHRAKITSKLIKLNYLIEQDNTQQPGLLCALFPFSNLKIYDFNRIVDYSEMKSPVRFMAELSKHFEIKYSKKAIKPRKKHQITLNLRNEWFVLTWKKTALNAYRKSEVILDVNLFNDLILNKILKIKDISASDKVKYTEGVQDLNNIILKMTDPMQCLFCLFPIEANDIIKTSDLGWVLPPKSTWFEPRMLNGFLVKEF